MLYKYIYHYPSSRFGMFGMPTVAQARMPDTSRMGGRRRGCRLERWLPMPVRCRRRQAFAVVLLLLAGTFSLRGWRTAMMISSKPSQAEDLDRWWASGLSDRGGETSQCEWQHNGTILYSLSRPDSGQDASHWSYVADCFMGRRPEFKEYFAGMRGARVYIQDLDGAWASRLTPMTRLFIAAGLTSVGVESIHFIDGSYSLFSYAPAAGRSGDRYPSGAREAAEDRDAGRMPSRGQVGVFRIDGEGYRSRFVVSSDQPLPERLVVSAPSSSWPSSRWGLRGRTGVPSRGEPGECVKFVAGVGSWGPERGKWFRSEDDARALQRSLSEFCPISWLVDKSDNVGDGDGDDGRRDVALGVGSRPEDDLYKKRGSGGDIYGQRGVARLQEHYNSRPRKLVIYQRDRNRRLTNTEEIALELYERLSNLGWSVTEIIHHPDNHPCEVVNELASADVLLTAYGFQSILALFMRPDSALFEVFPHKVVATGHGALAEGLGLRYRSVESRPLRAFLGSPLISRGACLRSKWCQSYARHSDVELSEGDLELVIEMMLQGGRER